MIRNVTRDRSVLGFSSYSQASYLANVLVVGKQANLMLHSAFLLVSKQDTVVQQITYLASKIIS